MRLEGWGAMCMINDQLKVSAWKSPALPVYEAMRAYPDDPFITLTLNFRETLAQMIQMNHTNALGKHVTLTYTLPIGSSSRMINSERLICNADILHGRIETSPPLSSDLPGLIAARQQWMENDWSFISGEVQ